MVPRNGRGRGEGPGGGISKGDGLCEGEVVERMFCRNLYGGMVAVTRSSFDTLTQLVTSPPIFAIL